MVRLASLRTNSILTLDFGWRSASALRKDLTLATNGKGTASAVPLRANKEAALAPASADCPESHSKKRTVVKR